MQQSPVTYTFGHGLSYTTFDYSKLELPAGPVDAGATIPIRVEIANTGAIDGDEVVQLYIHKTAGTQVRPKLQLKAFQRVTIAKGTSETVTLKLAVSDLGMWNTARKQFVVDPGSYEIMVGASAADIRMRGKLDVKR